MPAEDAEGATLRDYIDALEQELGSKILCLIGIDDDAALWMIPRPNLDEDSCRDVLAALAVGGWNTSKTR